MKTIGIIKLQSLLDELTIYRSILDDELIVLLKNYDEKLSLPCICSLLIEYAESNRLTGNIFQKYIINLFLNDENIFSLTCENNKDVFNSSLHKLALNDISIIKQVLYMELNYLFQDKLLINEICNYKPIEINTESNKIDLDFSKSPEDLLDSLISYYNKTGCGEIARYKSFKYDNSKRLKGIKSHDPITFNDLIGYESQIKKLKNNTEAFLRGYNANNVLLVGSRGTGKSSSVKALANEYFNKGLRLIEVTKDQISDLPEILSILKLRGLKFIVFIDDLSFDEQETQYKYFKTLLDGGSESKPQNVLFYVTSNRRHLIQEKWADRMRGSDEAEIHTSDTLNEKLALADRFGITITYPKPTPQEYINMVIEMANRNNIKMTDEELKTLALRWELTQRGMSGRTAKQFINNILWEN